MAKRKSKFYRKTRKFLKRRLKAPAHFKRNFNIVFGTTIFILLTGSAFTIDWIFGFGFIFGFMMSVYNQIIEKEPLIPIFVFLGGLIIRYAFVEIFPSVLFYDSLISLILSLVLFVVIIITGWKFRKGKWKIWKL